MLGERLQETDVTPVESIEQLMRRSRIIFLVVPAKFARDAAMEALPYMTKEHIFCDLTTNKPSVKEELGRDVYKRQTRTKSVWQLINVYQSFQLISL